jgi:hypothetical protein
MKDFLGYHSEWNLGSPGGWDYQRTTQEIGKAVWDRLNRISNIGVELDFEHAMLCPVVGFADMLLAAHRDREGNNHGVIAVVAEEDTLEDVTENINLADRLNNMDGITGILAAPHHLELNNGRVSFQGQPVSVIFMDFNTDVLLREHRKHKLDPLLTAVREKRVINPRGTEPINSKGMYEVLTGPEAGRFHDEIVKRTPWTRQFYRRRTDGPSGENIEDLLEWTRKNWENLVLKPERGYSGQGVMVGGMEHGADHAIAEALDKGEYIVQEKIPLGLWSEDNPELDKESGILRLARHQTDFRCLVGPDQVFGFLGRFGGVPTNVGSGGGVQPIGILRSDIPAGDAVRRINDAIMAMPTGDVGEVVEMQKEMALERKFTYLLGPIKIALRPRVLAPAHIDSLKRYCAALWKDCLLLEEMWLQGELDRFITIEKEELDIARSQPWKGSRAIIASDGLFSFGAHTE